jgi:SAM-dependent methyltransferase
VVAEDLVPAALRGRAGAYVLDVGCGRGDSVDAFRAVDPSVRWVGIDLADSVEAAERTRSDIEFVVFDGEHIPFRDATVDVVFCKQVLEHVERLEPLLAEMARVVRPGGALVGSTSQLEPYHGRSTGNHTPYGVKRALERHGFGVDALVPGIDGVTLIAFMLLRAPGPFVRWWRRRSPLNTLVDGLGRVLGWDAEDRNAVKLLFCGQFAFLARRTQP